jgi:hypothetical protein
MYVFYIAAIVPFLLISAIDFLSELDLALLGESSDSPQHAGMAAMVSILGPISLICLLVATALSIYVWWNGVFYLRVRISSWYSTLFLVVIFIIFGPHASDFSLRVYFALYQVMLVLPLAVLPVFWLYKELKTNPVT